MTQSNENQLDTAINERERSRTVKYSLIGLSAAILCTAGYAGYQAFRLSNSLFEVQDLAKVAESNLKAKDFESLVATVDAIKDATSTAQQAANDPILSLSRFLPIIGDDFTAVRILSDSAANIVVPASTAVQTVPLLTGSNIANTEIGFDVSLLESVSQSVSALSTATTQASKDLSAIDQTSLTTAIAAPLSTFEQLLDKTTPALHSASPYLKVLPQVLAQDTSTTWFVTMQNLGEARSSGGLPGAWLVIKAENGKLEVLRQGSNDVLIENEPVDYEQIMPSGYQEAWGDYLSSWLSMNLSANFPDNAALMLDNWNDRNEEQVDGVIALGQGMLPYVAAAVGDIEFDGKTIAPSDLDEYLTVKVYEDYPVVAEKDAAVDQIIAQVFAKVASGAFDLDALLSTFSEQSTGDYLQLWSTNPTIQQAIVQADMGGIMPAEMGPIASARIINGGENKLDIFLDVKAEYNLGQCVTDDEIDYTYRDSEFNLTLTNNAPRSGLPAYISGRGDEEFEGVTAEPGSNYSIAAIYTPIDATATEFLLDGVEAFPEEYEVDGRYMYLFDSEILSGETKTMTVRWEEPVVDELENTLSSTPEVVLPPLFRAPEVQTSSTGRCDS